MPDAARRGHALEGYVARLFQQRHFTVSVDSHAARPRQTDLIAVKLAERYLVECKWRRKPATINDIDSLRSRLNRTSPDVVGVLVSMSGFTDEVKTDVKYQRQQPVLLLSGDELRDLDAGYRVSLPDLLYRKKESLLRDAVVLLDDAWSRSRRSRQLPYPQPALRFARVDGTEPESVVDFRGGFDSPIFLDHLVDIDWTSADGAGVFLDVRLAFSDEAELVRAFDTLVDLGWVSEHGRWSIDQAARTWQGVGLRALLEQIPRWRQRVDHHSEQITYVDRCDGGFYSLSAEIAADTFRRVSSPQLSFQFEGLPLDTTPLLHLCRTLGVHDGLHVRPRQEKLVEVVSFRPEPIDLTLRALVVADDVFATAEWVVGIVVDNPFQQQGTRWFNKSSTELLFLSQAEYIICNLRNQHPWSEPRTQYLLERIEWVRDHNRILCCPVADWPK